MAEHDAAERVTGTQVHVLIIDWAQRPLEQQLEDGRTRNAIDAASAAPDEPPSKDASVHLYGPSSRVTTSAQAPPESSSPRQRHVLRRGHNAPEVAGTDTNTTDPPTLK